MTPVQPIIRYDAVIEAALNGTLRQAFKSVERAAAGSTTLRKTSIAAFPAAIPSAPSVLVNRDETNLLANQARQRAEYAARRAQTSGNEMGSMGMQKGAPADSDAAALFKASRLRRIVPGFYAGVR